MPWVRFHFVIWAHYILGLDVLISTGAPSVISFGDEQNPHVLITWSNLNPHPASILHVSHRLEKRQQPSIKLLDENMSVMRDSAPDSEQWRDIAVDTRYPLLGYGTIDLHRMLNFHSITNDN